MSVRQQLHERDGIFFITFTCQGWLPLFERTQGYETVYTWFDYLKCQGHFVCGYVIMPNHVHVLLGLRALDKPINTLVSNGKRFMAYALVERLQHQGHHGILALLSRAVSAPDRKHGKLHQVFEPSFDCKECYNEAFLL